MTASSLKNSDDIRLFKSCNKAHLHLRLKQSPGLFPTSQDNLSGRQEKSCFKVEIIELTNSSWRLGSGSWWAISVMKIMLNYFWAIFWLMIQGDLVQFFLTIEVSATIILSDDKRPDRRFLRRNPSNKHTSHLKIRNDNEGFGKSYWRTEVSKQPGHSGNQS